MTLPPLTTPTPTHTPTSLPPLTAFDYLYHLPLLTSSHDTHPLTSLYYSCSNQLPTSLHAPLTFSDYPYHLSLSSPPHMTPYDNHPLSSFYYSCHNQLPTSLYDTSHAPD